MKTLIMKLISLARRAIFFFLPSSVKEKMLSCEEVAFIIGNQEKSSLLQQLKLYMHLFICRDCQNYKDQIKGIGYLTEQIKSETAPTINDSKKTQEDLIHKYCCKK